METIPSLSLLNPTDTLSLSFYIEEEVEVLGLEQMVLLVVLEVVLLEMKLQIQKQVEQVQLIKDLQEVVEH